MENNHVHSFTSTLVPSNCKEHGYTLHKCACGYEHKDNFLPLATHNFEVGEFKAATCSEEGYRICRCAFCGEEKVEKAPALGHTWESKGFSMLPTCTEAGEELLSCSRCGITGRRAVNAKGHNLVNPQDSAEEGMLDCFCTNCGQTITVPKPEKKKNFFAKHKKGLIASAISLVLVAALVVCSIFFVVPPLRYNHALKLIEKEDYKGAYEIFYDMIDYKDSAKLIRNFYAIGEREEEEYSGTDDEGNEYTRKYVREYDKYGNTTLSKGYDDGELSYESEYEYEYDKDGNIINEKSYADGELSYETRYEYSKDGVRIKEEEYNGDNQLDYLYEYNEKGDQIRYENYEDGVLDYGYTYTYEYDKDDNVLVREEYGLDRTYKGCEKYEYDKDGNEIRYENYDYANNLTSYTVSEYNKNGDITSRKEYDSYGDLQYSYTYKYKYHENGEIKKEERYVDDVLSRIYEYDEYGFETAWEEFDDQGESSYRYEYEYDEYGNYTEAKGYRHGELESTVKAKCDEYGRMTSYVEYDADGEKVSEYECEYEGVMVFYEADEEE